MYKKITVIGLSALQGITKSWFLCLLVMDVLTLPEREVPKCFWCNIEPFKLGSWIFTKCCYLVSFTVFTSSLFAASPIVGYGAVTACRHSGCLKTEPITPSSIHWNTSPSLCMAGKIRISRGWEHIFCCCQHDSCINVRFISGTYMPHMPHTKYTLPHLCVSTTESAVGRSPIMWAWGRVGGIIVDWLEGVVLLQHETWWWWFVRLPRLLSL